MQNLPNSKPTLTFSKRNTQLHRSNSLKQQSKDQTFKPLSTIKNRPNSRNTAKIEQRLTNSIIIQMQVRKIKQKRKGSKHNTNWQLIVNWNEKVRSGTHTIYTLVAITGILASLWFFFLWSQIFGTLTILAVAEVKPFYSWVWDLVV